MSRSSSYSYTVLRYVHDTTTGEFMNVGVALYAPEAQFVSAICRTTYRRLANAFPGVSGEAFRALMRFVQARFDALCNKVGDDKQLRLTNPSDIMDFARQVLPIDDSSLQWSPPGYGLTKDPEGMLEKLFDRMVMSYDDRNQQDRRSDDEVWRSFKRSLERKDVLKHLQAKRIAVKDDEVEFRYAWKNGVWHCLEPVSFDLSDAERIRDKAHKWLGQIASLREASDEFRLYFLLGEPQRIELMPAYENAISILRKSPVRTDIYSEQQAESLTEAIAAEVKSHEAQPNPEEGSW